MPPHFSCSQYRHQPYWLEDYGSYNPPRVTSSKLGHKQGTKIYARGTKKPAFLPRSPVAEAGTFPMHSPLTKNKVRSESVEDLTRWRQQFDWIWFEKQNYYYSYGAKGNLCTWKALVGDPWVEVLLYTKRYDVTIYKPLFVRMKLHCIKKGNFQEMERRWVSF